MPASIVQVVDCWMVIQCVMRAMSIIVGASMYSTWSAKFTVEFESDDGMLNGMEGKASCTILLHNMVILVQTRL